MAHIYRNRSDDTRPVEELHFCAACDGYYGVPHTNSHCQRRETSTWMSDSCACRFCRRRHGKPIEGAFGVIL